MLNKLKKVKGFTLIELIIVIAIIAILAAIAVPAFGQIRQKANISSDVANARSIYSLVATELASDKLGSDTALTLINDAPGGAYTTVIADLIEPAPKVKTYQNYKFAYTITDGKIQIFVTDAKGSGATTYEVYPNGATGSKYGSN